MSQSWPSVTHVYYEAANAELKVTQLQLMHLSVGAESSDCVYKVELGYAVPFLLFLLFWRVC